MNELPARTGDWMQTFSGRQFWPMDPRPNEIFIEDIAHALANLCRYGGHCLRFYSVAEHSVLMARAVSPENKLWALMHDAAEAYLVDVPRPIKRFLSGYALTESRIIRRIADRYNLPFNGGDGWGPVELPIEVEQADLRILADEKHQNMRQGPSWDLLDEVQPLGVTLQFWTPEQAEHEFLDTFAELTK